MLSISPIIYIPFFVAFTIAMSFATNYPAPLLILFPLYMLTGLINLGLTLFFVIHAIKTIDPKDDMRIIWVIIILLVGILANPVYWYLNVWRDKKKGSSTPTPSA
jgi:hypothetical protein